MDPAMALDGWRKDAACIDPPIDKDDWFSFSQEAMARAKRICFECPVKEECLDYALTRREKHGVWGGLDWDERKRMLRARRKAS